MTTIRATLLVAAIFLGLTAASRMTQAHETGPMDQHTNQYQGHDDGGFGHGEGDDVRHGHGGEYGHRDGDGLGHDHGGEYGHREGDDFGRHHDSCRHRDFGHDHGAGFGPGFRTGGFGPYVGTYPAAGRGFGPGAGVSFGFTVGGGRYVIRVGD